jgi:uncharacterized protein YyaL (SSP411 family)
MPNRLSDSTSPYLLQHADNPVDWYEWSDEALEAARNRDVPIFLSVGYSACHWCHVMAHESFEDTETAAYMNDNFVNIKVDREERPDIDRIYMDAVQAMTGQGGWPMSVFLTPGARPIMAGTYFPPRDMGHRPSFRRVMEAVVDAWRHRRPEVSEQADKLTAAVGRALPVADSLPGRDLVHAAVSSLAGTFDETYGGFGGAPKFPQAPNVELLLRVYALDPDGPQAATIGTILRTTLDRMAGGGIYDHLGGGFARYAVDRTWLVPHFEKMLYDNALLARLYLRAWQLFGVARYREVTEQTLDYLLRDMRDPRGGLHAAEDADSDGAEGLFYVWERSAFDEVLGDRADLMARLYGVTDSGNFEGANVLHIAVDQNELAVAAGLSPSDMAAERSAADAMLLEARNSRQRPGKDDKVIAAWNGLAIRALAEAGTVLGNGRYLRAAEEVAHFCLEELRRDDGRLLRSKRSGRGSVPAFCDDYGALAVAMLSLYQATGDEVWFQHGKRLTGDMIGLFADPAGGGFFATGNDAETLIARPKNLMDNPTPSDNALAAEALQILHALSGDPELRVHLEGVLRASSRLLEQYPAAVGYLAAVMASDRPQEIAVLGSGQARHELTAVVWETFRPRAVLAQGDGSSESVPLLADRTPGDKEARAYVCEDFVCALPVDTPEELRVQLEA